MPSVLNPSPHLPESLLGHLVELLPAQAEIVALVGTDHLLEDVLVIRRVPLSLRTVNKPFDLTEKKQNNSRYLFTHTVHP